MSAAPAKGANGSDSFDAVRAAAPAQSPAVVLPGSVLQPCPYPYLEAFAARGKMGTGKRARDMVAYELSFGVRVGLATGREMQLTIPKGMRGRPLAARLREVADSLDRWAADCEAQGIDPRDETTSAEGQKAAPDPVAVAFASRLLCSRCTNDVPAIGCAACAALRARAAGNDEAQDPQG